MKSVVFLILSLFFYGFFPMLTAQENELQREGVMLVPVGKSAKPAPTFFSASADVEVRRFLDRMETVSNLHYDLHQGTGDRLSLSISGEGEIIEVKGDGLVDWCLRRDAAGQRFLDVKLQAADAGKKRWDLQVKSQLAWKAGNKTYDVWLLGQGDAVGFTTNVALLDEGMKNARVIEVENLSPVGKSQHLRFVGQSRPRLRLDLSQQEGEVTFRDAQLQCSLAKDQRSMSFVFTARAEVKRVGVAVEFCRGAISLSDEIAADGWHMNLRGDGKNDSFEWVADRVGDLPVEIRFDVPVTQRDYWSLVQFNILAGVVVPLWIDGLPGNVKFDPDRSVVPSRQNDRWRGFLPVDGCVSLAWRTERDIADGALFFSSTEISELRVSSGLLRQNTKLDLQILQGKLPSITLQLHGDGEVLSVQSEQVVGWSVRQAENKRLLDLQLSRAATGAVSLTIDSQSSLGNFPVKASGLRLEPVGSLRHSGWLRIANEGAVKIEVGNTNGLIQLSPEQFPREARNLRQAFVYRFPSVDYAYLIGADHVLPETSVNELTVYELAETDRRIIADVELDIREAPLREWEILVPEDYTVVSCVGAAVADYALATTVSKGLRSLKILFREAVRDRQLMQLRLEKNEAAKQGSWILTPLQFPNAKSHRGFIGVVTVPGFRISGGQRKNLAEVPLSYFPKQSNGLQQSYRIKESAWSATMNVEALGQSVQADVFHLYSVKEGAVYGSVLFNYFVVGAPASEWRVQIPKAIGNIEITGQNIGHEWRREGNVLVIPLSRPLLGAGTMLLSFEQPMQAAGGEIFPGEIRPLNVQAESGYVQVVSPLQVDFQVSENSGNVLPLQVNELPPDYRVLSSAPTLSAWQYTARDFTIGMKFKWFKAGETVEQVVDFVQLSSQISRDGQLVTEAKFFVKSKRREALRMTLPNGAILLETKVNHLTANPRVDDDSIVIPLPQKNDLNQAVEVLLRYGSAASNGDKITLQAPVLQAPTVIGEWKVLGDEGRILTPLGGTVEVVRMPIQMDGFEWLSRHWAATLLLICLLALSWLMTRLKLVSILALLIAAVTAAGMALSGWPISSVSTSLIEYAAPVVKAGTQMTVLIANESLLASVLTRGFWIAIVSGLIALGYGCSRRDRWWTGGSVVLFAISLLCIRNGVSIFLVATSLYALVTAVSRLRPKVLRQVTSAAAIAVIAMLTFSQICQAQEILPEKTAERLVIDAEIRSQRLFGEATVTVRAESGDRFSFFYSPAVLSEFQGEGLRVVRETRGDRSVYVIVADQAGILTARAKFEMAVARPQQPWNLPVAIAVVRKITLRWDQPGWEFVSPAATRSEAKEDADAKLSTSVMWLKPVTSIDIVPQPKQRERATVPSVFFVESSQLMIPLPGVVNGFHSIKVRPSQGQVSELVMQIPAGFTVSDVTDGPTGVWRFEPNKSELRVAIEPAQNSAFSLTVHTQRGSAALPVEMKLEPLRVKGAANEVGLMALAFGDDAQPEKITVEGLAPVNPDDFKSELLPRDAKGNALATLQQVYRFAAPKASLQARITSVAAEMRAESWQVLSLGDDRMVLSSDLSVTITRAGIFRLLLEIPKGLEIESASGAALNHWTEAESNGARVMTLHLNGRTMGRQQFHLSFTGPSTGAQKTWQVPRLILREATRESGLLTIVPEQGMRIGVVERENVSPIDPRDLADEPQAHAKAAMRLGALAFRLLQRDWKLGLSIDELEPWITAQVFHEVVLREGQLSTKMNLVYQIENAAIKTLRVRLPGLSDVTAGTVRATGPSVADFLKVDGEKDVWEIRFQRGVSGSNAVDLEFQQQLPEGTNVTVEPIRLLEARQVGYFSAVRSGGRMELGVDGELSEGWSAYDWAAIQAAMPKLRSELSPVLSFKVANPDNGLKLSYKRHQLAEIQKMRVADGQLTTLISSRGEALTSVQLRVQVAEKGSLRLRLPKAAELYNVLVNDEGASLVREGDEWLFYVFPAADVNQPSTVRFVYASGAGESMKLEGPSLSVPMENLSWHVLIPEGWRLRDHQGDFDLKNQNLLGSFRLENYQEYVSARKVSSSAEAVALFDQASSWIKQGDQEKASIALGNAARNGLLDEASNEDARVQLRELRTQQALLGLNTRRQKMFLDNKSQSGVDNQQLEQAAQVNPLLQGKFNYDPQQFDRFIEGNTADENAALQAIAQRIVNQQLAAEPAPSGLEISVPERGSILTFGRSIQVDGGKPLLLQLDLEKDQKPHYVLALVLCLLLAIGVVFPRSRKNQNTSQPQP
ncbi:MAG: hypothetical protein ACOVRB_05025 [Akkermansiaceae bacterium]